MSAAAAETHASILSLPELVNNDAGLVRRGRYLTATFLVEAGDAEFLVRVVEGRVAAVERGPFLMRSWTFALRASAESWQRFWEPTPAPGHHDLFAPRARDAGRAHELADLLRRQMLSIARALALDPDMLLLDEPFEGLSPAIVPTVAAGIAEITQRGHAI
ncbi:MAG TPA: hypothetical protein VK746_14215, partial [Candidatus Eisenbacteria bacterium]|nr:hypothetical protein [Candidatus Eisenbacteria bacterium]